MSGQGYNLVNVCYDLWPDPVENEVVLLGDMNEVLAPSCNMRLWA